MKKTLNIRNFVTLIVGVLFSMSLSAQVLIPDSLSLFNDITAYTLNYDDTHHQDGVGVTEGTGGWAVEFIQADDWIEFQIIAEEAGQYVLTAPISSSRTTSNVNVSVYPEDGEFEMNGTTLYTYNGQWQRPVEYLFPFTVEADVVYNLRVSFVGHGCNFFNEGLEINPLSGSTDATLSDLQVDGVTVADFDPATLSYSIALEPFAWFGGITATANDPLSTISMPDDFTQVDGSSSASYDITVTSESGIISVYTVNVVTPVSLYDGAGWDDLDDSFTANNAYYNNGVYLNWWGINNLNNGDYYDMYVFSEWGGNFDVGVFYSNGYGKGSSKPDGMNYLNISTLELGDTTWAINDIYTRYLAPTYYAGDTVPSWDADPAVYQNFVITLPAMEPVLLRIYAINNTGNSANIQSISFEEISGSIDATLSDLTVDGTTVMDFDPMTTTYSVALPAGATTATLAATATDAGATLTGDGTIDLVGDVTADTITVVSESGFDISYIVNFYTPIAVDFTLADTFSLAMYSDMFYNGGANVSNTLINKSYDSTYVEYYIYSETDKDVHLVANMTNGNPDTISTEMNVSTYVPGSEWALNNNTRTVPYSDSMMWTVDKAEELEFNVSLTAGEAVMLRLFFITDGTLGSGDIHSLSIVDGYSPSASTSFTEVSDVKIYGGSASLTVDLGSSVSSSVKVFDIAGRAVINDITKSSKKVYNVTKAGVYIVQVVDENNNMKTVKCLVQ